MKWWQASRRLWCVRWRFALRRVTIDFYPHDRTLSNCDPFLGSRPRFENQGFRGSVTWKIYFTVPGGPHDVSLSRRVTVSYRNRTPQRCLSNSRYAFTLPQADTNSMVIFSHRKLSASSFLAKHSRSSSDWSEHVSSRVIFSSLPHFRPALRMAIVHVRDQTSGARGPIRTHSDAPKKRSFMSHVNDARQHQNRNSITETLRKHSWWH